MKYLPPLLALLLAGPRLPALAQASPSALVTPPATLAASTYQVEHDSLQQRVARGRTRLEKATVRFKTHHAGLADTSRRTQSTNWGPDGC